MKKTIALTALALLAAPTIALASAVPAQADDDDRTRTGSCSGTTDWKIKADPNDGRMEVEAEIDSFRSGQTWRWTLKRDGNVVDTGRSTTRGPSGSFDVDRRTPDPAGRDTFTFRAVNPGTGEVCLARVRR
ncbi:hypothetical protein GCM10027062_33170 [Nocardioides hungaricus]